MDQLDIDSPNHGAAMAALRVSQMDANEFDVELCSLVLNQYKQILEALSVVDVSRFDPEATLLVRLLFWLNVVRGRDCTLGQEMMNMSYANFSPVRKSAHFLSTVIAPYVRERLCDLVSVFNVGAAEVVERRVLKKLDILLELGNVANFICFLNRGGFRSLIERIIGVKAVHNTRPVLGELDYSEMNRELLWHGFTDILMFVLPLLKVRNLWNFLKRRFKPNVDDRSIANVSDDYLDSSMMMSTDFVRSCALCEEYPILPCHFGCGHCFCYYCLYASLNEYDDFSCPTCGALAKDKSVKFVFASKKK